MDTKTLTVGQEVHMVSGVYGKTGKVVKNTPSGVDVQTGVMHVECS
jgi:preprotein translocase subunit YajC